MAYTVKQLAELAGISVRTLHHYDEIGLFKPSHCNENGYRFYEEEALLRLQQILFFKELGFGLREIHSIIESSNYNVVQALQVQKTLLTKKVERIHGLLATIDQTISKLKGEIEMSNRDLFNHLCDDQIEQYKKEARELFGDKMVDISDERTRHFTKKDYQSINEEYDEIFSAISKHMNEGYDCNAVQEQVKQLHQVVRRFWPCEKEHFVGLGELYRTHEDFIALYKKYDENLPEFLYKAIEFYCSQD